MQRKHEDLLHARRMGCSGDLNTPTRGVLGAVFRDVKVDDEPRAPCGEKSAEKHRDTEQLDGESKATGGPSGAKVEVYLQMLDEDKGRERVEESELAHLGEGQACVQAGEPIRHGFCTNEQDPREALGIEMKS